MDDYFGLAYAGAPFRLFSAAHVLAILTVVAASLAIVAALRRWPGPRLREALRYGLAGVCTLNQVAWDGWQAWVGLWSPAYSLPLHICTLSGVLCVIMVLARSRRLYELLYFWGLAGSGNALLTPDLQIYGFPHFRFWLFFTAHGAVIAAVVFMSAAYGLRPTWGALWRAVALTNAYMLVAALANAATGGNYLYLARKPEFATLMDYLGPWPWYILGLELVGIASFLAVYLPWAVGDWRAAAMASHHVNPTKR
ncbi:MAG TPA: TIGR02206 family membrane protein [Roseiflexaceae bacterium]|nr:TIGR02206 family membrane protein [Roseiflexaceae bacterium]